MTVFNIKSITDWKPLAVGEILEFPAYTGARTVAMSFITNYRIDVYASLSDDMSDKWLIASADGAFSISVGIAVDLYIAAHGLPEAEIVMRCPAASHIVRKTDEPVFTTPVPHGRRNSELDRVMQMVKLNEARRDQKLQHTLDELRAEEKNRRSEKLKPVVQDTSKPEKTKKDDDGEKPSEKTVQTKTDD